MSWFNLVFPGCNLAKGTVLRGSIVIIISCKNEVDIVLLITSNSVGVEFGSLEEIRNALNNSNSTQIAKLLADLVSRLIKNGQLASREFSVVSIHIYM